MTQGHDPFNHQGSNAGYANTTLTMTGRRKRLTLSDRGKTADGRPLDASRLKTMLHMQLKALLEQREALDDRIADLEHQLRKVDQGLRPRAQEAGEPAPEPSVAPATAEEPEEAEATPEAEKPKRRTRKPRAAPFSADVGMSAF